MKKKLNFELKQALIADADSIPLEERHRRDSEEQEQKHSGVDEEQASVATSSWWKPKEAGASIYFDLFPKLPSVPPPLLKWSDGGETGFFKVPDVTDILWSSITSSAQGLTTAFSYFVFVVTYVGKITLRRAPQDETSEILFLMGLLISSLSPLIFCFFLLKKRLEFAAREILYYHLLKSNIIVDFENKAFYFSTKLFWFGFVASVFIACFGIYQNFHLAPDGDSTWDRLDLYYAFFCASQTVSFWLFGANIFGIEARLVTVNQVVEWARFSDNERRKKLRRSASSHESQTRQRRGSTTHTQALQYLATCAVIDEMFLKWLLLVQVQATAAFAKENQAEISSFPTSQKKQRLRELEQSKGFRLDLNYETLVGFRDYLDTDLRLTNLKHAGEPNLVDTDQGGFDDYAVRWVRTSSKYATDDSLKTTRKWIRMLFSAMGLAIIVLEVYGMYRINTTQSEESASSEQAVGEFCVYGGFCDGPDPIYNTGSDNYIYLAEIAHCLT